jgi:hypothetical protein
MIADLKADSERWEAERRQTASRGQPQNGISSRDSERFGSNSNTPVVEYRSSTTHQSRQYYGPTEAAPPVQGVYPAATSVQPQGVYDSPQYQSSTTYAQPAQGYGSTTQGYGSSVQGYGAAPQGYAAPDQYYVAGAKMLLLPTNSLIHVIILKLAHLQYHQHRDTHSNLQIHSLVVVRTITSQFFNFLFVENEKCLTI